MIATMYHNVYLMSVFVVNEDHPSTERKGKLTCLNKQVKISRLFHCDGLLLCILKHKSIVVWNPYSGQTRWIETNSESENDTDDESENNTEDESEYEMEVKHKYALGYVSSNKNQSFRHHKIVKFRDDLDQRNKVLWYKIYDFDSDSWRNPDWCLVSGEFGVSINGNTYWCARETNKYVVDHLICFDFTRERFGPLLPLPFRAGTDATLSCVGDEKIAVLFQEPEPYRMEIWISSKIVEAETKMSWSKFFTVDTGPLAQNSYSSFTNGTYFIDEEKKVAMVIDEDRFMSKKDCDTVNIVGEGGYFREVDLGQPANEEEWCWPHVWSYVPSSVQI